MRRDAGPSGLRPTTQDKQDGVQVEKFIAALRFMRMIRGWQQRWRPPVADIIDLTKLREAQAAADAFTKIFA